MQCKKCGEELVGNKSICNMCGTYNGLGGTKEKKRREMIASLKIGDEVTSVDGMRGKVTRIEDDVIVLETGIDTTKSFIAIESNAIIRLIKEGPAKVADVTPMPDEINNEILNETIGNNVAEDCELSEQERKKTWRNSYLVAFILIVVVITSCFLNNEDSTKSQKSTYQPAKSTSTYKSSTSSSTSSSSNSNSSTSATEPATPNTSTPTTSVTPSTTPETKKAIPTYPNYPTVPDFGAMFDLEATSVDNNYDVQPVYSSQTIYNYGNNAEKYIDKYIGCLEDHNFVHVADASNDSISSMLEYSDDIVTIYIMNSDSGATGISISKLIKTPSNIPTHKEYPSVPDFSKIYNAPIIEQTNVENDAYAYYIGYQYPFSYTSKIDDYTKKLINSGFMLINVVPISNDGSNYIAYFRKGTTTIAITKANAFVISIIKAKP